MSATTHATNHGDALWFIDSLVYVRLDGANTGDAFALVEMLGRQGDMPPLHVHSRDDETFYVLDGELKLHAGSEEITLTAGQAALAPRAVPHTYRVVSATARWLVINSPAGFEHFLRAASEPAANDQLPPPGRRLDPAQLAQTAAEQGIELLGPPGTLPSAHHG
jgi:quercetin dioxygenase-like cupin family protein